MLESHKCYGKKKWSRAFREFRMPGIQTRVIQDINRVIRVGVIEKGSYAQRPEGSQWVSEPHHTWKGREPQAKVTTVARTAYLTCLKTIKEASIVGTELENRRVGAEVRGITRGKNGKSCMALNTIVKTLVFTLKDMGSYYSMLSKHVVWSDFDFTIITLAAVLKTDCRGVLVSYCHNNIV